MRTFSTTAASISDVTFGSSVVADSVTGVRSRLASLPTMAASASLGSSARPSFSGTITGRSPTSLIAASRCATSPLVIGRRTRSNARGLTLACGVTSDPKAQTASRRKPRIGLKPSVFAWASATAPRQSTSSARSDGRTRKLRPSTVTASGTRRSAASCPSRRRTAAAGERPATSTPAICTPEGNVFGDPAYTKATREQHEGQQADAGDRNASDHAPPSLSLSAHAYLRETRFGCPGLRLHEPKMLARALEPVVA